MSHRSSLSFRVSKEPEGWKGPVTSCCVQGQPHAQALGVRGASLEGVLREAEVMKIEIICVFSCSCLSVKARIKGVRKMNNPKGSLNLPASKSLPLN